MPENNFNSLAPDPQQVPQTPPPPPSAESLVGVRTMAGDISSMNSSGGMEPQAQTFNPRDLGNGEPAFQPQSGAQAGVPVPPGAQSVPQNQNIVLPHADNEAYRKHHMKMLVISITSVILIGILAATTYFLFFRGPAEVIPAVCPEGQTGTPPNCVTTPPVSTVLSATIEATPSTINEGETVTLKWETTNAIDVIIEGIGGVEASGTRAVTPAESTSYHLIAKAADGTTSDSTVQITVIPKPVVAAFQHTSLFPASSSVSSVNLSLSAFTIDEFETALRAAAGAEVASTVLREFVTVLPDGPVDALRFFPVFLPALASLDFVMPIEKDFTAFFYKDKDGVWPGYVMTVAAGQDASLLLKEIEKSPAVFYLDDPGAPKATEFKNGAKLSPNTTSVRYLVYSKPGASFDIATVKIADKNYIIISTSFNGIKEAVRLLKF